MRWPCAFGLDGAIDRTVGMNTRQPRGCRKNFRAIVEPEKSSTFRREFHDFPYGIEFEHALIGGTDCSERLGVFVGRLTPSFIGRFLSRANVGDPFARCHGEREQHRAGRGEAADNSRSGGIRLEAPDDENRGSDAHDGEDCRARRRDARGLYTGKSAMHEPCGNQRRSRHDGDFGQQHGAGHPDNRKRRQSDQADGAPPQHFG